MAPAKEYFATRMPNVCERFPKDADSASVEMVGRETVEHAPVRLYKVYNSIVSTSMLITFITLPIIFMSFFLHDSLFFVFLRCKRMSAIKEQLSLEGRVHKYCGLV